MYRHLQNIIRDIERRQCFAHHLPHKSELINSLQKLPSLERKYIRQRITKNSQSDWNVGSANIFSILQESKVLDFEEFICTVDDAETIQLILNDVLESNFQLLANLVKHLDHNNANSMKVATNLHTAFRRLIEDILHNTDIVKTNHLFELKALLSTESLDAVRLLHFNIFLECNNNSSSCISVKNALGQQKQWNESFPAKTMIESLMQDILTDQMVYLPKLFDAVTSPEFTGWEYYLHFIRFISVTKSADILIRKFLKETVQKCIDKQCDIYLYVV